MGLNGKFTRLKTSPKVDQYNIFIPSNKKVHPFAVFMVLQFLNCMLKHVAFISLSTLNVIQHLRDNNYM